MMSTRTWTLIIAAILAVTIAVVGFVLATGGPRDTMVSPSPATTTPVSDTPAAKKPSGPAALSDRVMVTSPEKGDHVEHSFTVAGLAPGPWFFEAQFPVMVRAADGSVAGRAIATAQGEWMTEKQVTFTASMQIDATYNGKATLVLLKDNPSGLPEHDDAVEIPIVVD